MSLLLNRTSAPQVIRFFTLCYKQGVIDACEKGSDLDVKEFLQDHLATWSFGTLEHMDVEYDWKAFQYWAYWFARQNGLKGLAENYIFRIRSKNYIWCFLPYCQRFYYLGIEDWLKHPSPARIELFKATPKALWVEDGARKNITKPDVISYLHSFEFEYRQLPEEEKEVSDMMMGSFIQALYDLSRKYVTGSKFEEDI